MTRVIPSLPAALVVSTILVLPFLLLELLMNQQQQFPFALFIFLWVLQFAFILTAWTAIREFRLNGSLSFYSIGFVVNVLLSLLMMAVWLQIIVDQMPCFLGFPNCD